MKKIFTFILAVLMIVSSMPIVFAEESEVINYNLHKDLIYDYEVPVGDKAEKEFETTLKNFSVIKANTYVDNQGIKYTFSYKNNFAQLDAIYVPAEIETYVLPATVTLYYFVAVADAPTAGYELTEKEKLPISWDMPIGVALATRDIEINTINTKILGSVDAPKIVLSQRITMISDSSFNTDVGMELKEIYAPSVEVIGKKAFLGCTRLESVYMPNLRRVDESAFEQCFSLKNINSEKIQVIGKNAFKDCSSLKHIALSKQLTYLNEGAFSGCTALESVEIPSGIQINTLPKNCFLSCTSLKEVTLPYEIIVISEGVFSGCANLNVINFINTNVSTIGKNAFFGCLRLETAYMPSSLVSVVPTSFESCPNLRFVYFASQLSDAQITSFEKANLGDKIITEKDITGPVININDNDKLIVAPSEITCPPTKLTITDKLDVVSVSVLYNGNEINATSRIDKVNAYSTMVWDVLLTESGEYKVVAIDAVGNKTEQTYNYINSEIMLTKDDVSVNLNEFYDELPVYPPVTVTKNGKILEQDVHYTVEYKNADTVGAAQIIVKGIDPYKGEIVVNYEIKEKPFILGDANKDGKITASDARLVLRMSAMLETYDDEMIKIVDVTGEGKISAADARKILRISAMLE